MTSEVHTLLTLNKNLKTQSSSGPGLWGEGLSKEKTKRGSMWWLRGRGGRWKRAERVSIGMEKERKKK